MAVTPTLFASGTQLAVVGTEHFLSSPAVPGVFTLHVDLANMAVGDVLVLRLYQKILAGGTARVVEPMIFEGVQPADYLIPISIPIGNDLTEANAVRFSLTQTFGVGVNYAWKVLQY